MIPPRLTIELVPSTCWYSNLRSELTYREWEMCKAFVKARSGKRCEVCGGRGRRWPVECHEVWEYDHETLTQTLRGLIALCPACHEVKHIGRAEVMGNLDRAAMHLARINGWDQDDTLGYIEASFELWSLRSSVNWSLDVSWLPDNLGIAVANVDANGR